jgi:hypothetical protein
MEFMRKNKYIPRIQRVLREVSSDPSSVDHLAKTLDQLIATKQLPTEEQALNSLISSKAIIPDPYSDPVPNIPAPGGNGTSKLAVRTNPNYLAYAANFSMLNQFVQYSQEGIRNQYKNIPPFGDPSRDFMLSQVWRHEPILAGAIYSMCAKQSSLKWSVTGRRLPAKRLAVLLAGAAFIDGYDWGGFMSGTAEDFFSTNRGFFWETPRLGDPVFGQLSDLGHIDALCCTLTGSKVTPMIYTSAATGQVIHFGPGEYNHAASLPSARELHLGAGFCAVDRALRAAILLMGLHDYDSEKLSNLPPEGVAAVTGLTKDELQDALTLWLAERKKNSSLTFPQVLWLVASQPNASVDVKMVSFSQLPEQFDRKTVIEQYVNTLSLAFGVDAREFWSLSGGGLGSAGESSIQHMKARGKGGSELTTIVERKINGEAPEDTFFGIDDPDVQAIADEAKVAKAWVDAYLPLYNLRPAGGPTQFGGGVVKANPTPENRDGSGNSPTSPILGLADTGGNMSSQAGGAKLAEQVITKDELLRLLIDHGVLPDWMVDDQRTAVGDSEVHQRRILAQKEGHGEDYTKFVWQKGALTEERLPPIVLRGVAYFEPFELAPIVMAEVLDEETQAKSVLNYLHLKASQILDGHRNIHGKPIPEAEVVRGSAVNKKVIHEELERWRHHAVLSKYAPTPAEEEQMFGNLKSMQDYINKISV